MYVFFGLQRRCNFFGQRRCTYSFGLLKVNGGVRILLVYLRSTEVYVFFWFT